MVKGSGFGSTTVLVVILCASLISASAADRRNSDSKSTAPLSIERCDAPMAKLAIADVPARDQQVLLGLGLPGPTELIAALVKQSNCFELVQFIVSPQSLKMVESLRANGQPVPDFVLSHETVFAGEEKSTLGRLGDVGTSFLPSPVGRTRNAITAGKNAKAMQTQMVLTDLGTKFPVAEAEMLTSQAGRDIRESLRDTPPLSERLAGYWSTPEGKKMSEAYAYNWNDIVLKVRGNLSPASFSALQNQGSQRRPTSLPTAPAGPRALQAGDVLTPKFIGVKMYASADKGSKVVSDQSNKFVFMGEESGDFVKVTSAKGEGWVEKLLVSWR